MLERIRELFTGEVRGAKRSARWPALRRSVIEKVGECEACGGKEQLEAHHINPVHLFPTLELVEGNIIVLCEKHGCHFGFGHLLDYHSYNIHVRCDAASFYKKVKRRP